MNIDDAVSIRNARTENCEFIILRLSGLFACQDLESVHGLMDNLRTKELKFGFFVFHTLAAVVTSITHGIS